MKPPREVARDLFFRLTGEIPDDGRTDREWLDEVERVIDARDDEHEQTHLDCLREAAAGMVKVEDVARRLETKAHCGRQEGWWFAERIRKELAAAAAKEGT